MPENDQNSGEKSFDSPNICRASRCMNAVTPGEVVCSEHLEPMDPGFARVTDEMDRERRVTAELADAVARAETAEVSLLAERQAHTAALGLCDLAYRRAEAAEKECDEAKDARGQAEWEHAASCAREAQTRAREVALRGLLTRAVTHITDLDRFQQGVIAGERADLPDYARAIGKVRREAYWNEAEKIELAINVLLAATPADAPRGVWLDEMSARLTETFLRSAGGLTAPSLADALRAALAALAPTDTGESIPQTVTDLAPFAAALTPADHVALDALPKDLVRQIVQKVSPSLACGCCGRSEGCELRTFAPGWKLPDPLCVDCWRQWFECGETDPEKIKAAVLANAKPAPDGAPEGRGGK